jgi:uncharacterized protein YecT (DUF1311 family)
MRRAGAIALAAVLLAGHAGAQGRDCSAMATQMEINACLSENFGAWQAEMERHYASALARLSETDEMHMRAGQLAFVTYRDMICEVEAGAMRGGSGEPMMRLQCLGRLTERRARDLQAYLGWFE